MGLAVGVTPADRWHDRDSGAQERFTHVLDRGRLGVHSPAVRTICSITKTWFSETRTSAEEELLLALDTSSTF
jgi:hypothetical protein